MTTTRLVGEMTAEQHAHTIEQRRRYRERNREKIRLAAKVYRDDKPETVRVNKARWQRDNRHACNVLNRRFRDATRDKERVRWRFYKIRKFGISPGCKAKMMRFIAAAVATIPAARRDEVSAKIVEHIYAGRFTRFCKPELARQIMDEIDRSALTVPPSTAQTGDA